MMFTAQLDEAKDGFDKTRTHTTKEGQTITLKRVDPFGFIEVNFLKGKTPDVLRDAQFTNFREAEKAVIKYLNKKA